VTIEKYCVYRLEPKAYGCDVKMHVLNVPSKKESAQDFCKSNH